MNFLSNVLREDGGFEYKKVIVDSILILIREIPEAKEPGLGHLCEFIEVNVNLPCRHILKHYHNITTKQRACDLSFNIALFQEDASL